MSHDDDDGYLIMMFSGVGETMPAASNRRGLLALGERPVRGHRRAAVEPDRGRLPRMTLITEREECGELVAGHALVHEQPAGRAFPAQALAPG